MLLINCEILFLDNKNPGGSFLRSPGRSGFIAGLGLHFSSRCRILSSIFPRWNGAAASAAAHAKEPLGPALHQNDLHNYGQNQNGADDGNGVIVHGPLPVYVLNLGAAMPQSPSLRRAFCRKSQDRSRENGVSLTGTPPPLLRPIGHSGASPTKDGFKLRRGVIHKSFFQGKEGFFPERAFSRGIGLQIAAQGMVPSSGSM
jgi:hypothetical protein